MTQTETNTTVKVKVLSPTLHFYHYVLRQSLNESLEERKERRKFFENNLKEITSRLTCKKEKFVSDFLQLIDIKKEPSSGTIFDFKNTKLSDKCPNLNATDKCECHKPNSDRLYLETGIFKSRLAARCLNDTYFLRLTRYISSNEGEQSLNSFANLSEYLNTLKIELGQTAILAGIVQSPLPPETTTRQIAVSCLHKYFSQIPEEEIEEKISQEYKFLDSPFYVLSREITLEQSIENYQFKTTNLACVFLYKDEAAERKADRVYSIFRNLLFSYHKINYFYFQSRSLKIRLKQLYKAIEEQTKSDRQQILDPQILVKLPQESLQYYQLLSFFEDQARLIKVQQRNYQEAIEIIEKQTGEAIPKFFTNFQENINFYLDQMEADIGFLSPAIQLYERLMLSVQTQVSINEAAIQEKQDKLGQILTVAGTTIALGQIAQQPITTTISQRIDGVKSLQPSLFSLWISAIVTIVFSLIIGYGVSRILSRWFTKK